VADRALLSELRAIAERSAKAADAGGSESALLETYEALRERVEVLARAHGLSTSEDLATSFPSAQALREIERLDQSLGPESSRALPTDPGMSARLSESLRELAGWATGVRLAYETLGDSDNDARTRR
jgi:hypothetical protein